MIDLGCGNGFTCCQLAAEGYSNLTGIDYSENAIKLAQSISEKEEFNIEYKVCFVSKLFFNKYFMQGFY